MQTTHTLQNAHVGELSISCPINLADRTHHTTSSHPPTHQATLHFPGGTGASESAKGQVHCHGPKPRAT